MTPKIEKTVGYLAGLFEKSRYFADHPGERTYRWEHTLRVARIGGEIARAEGMDEEAMVIACLLHDAAYGLEMPEGYDWHDHGRDSARLVRAFVEGLGLPEHAAADILYGIAIHVDGKADFPGEDSAFAETVSDADNIDRFGPWRIYETIQRKGFPGLPLEERIGWLEQLLPQLEHLQEMELATPTARRLWRERLGEQMEFYRRLLRQMEQSRGLV